ncbi:MAG: hypothetical protein ACTSXD_06585 [Candidatus Heimdallarchaeaceae archaeon]
MKKQLILFFAILVLMIPFILPNVSAGYYRMRQEDGRIILSHSGFPSKVSHEIEAILAKYNLNYAHNQIYGTFLVDEEYNVYINDLNTPFTNLLKDLSALAINCRDERGIDTEESEFINGLNSAMRKFQALILENAYSKESGFRISKELVFEEKYRRFEGGTITCSGKCYIGALITDKTWFNIAMKNCKLEFVSIGFLGTRSNSINERLITFNSQDSYVVSYKSDIDRKENNRFITVTRGDKSNQVTYYVKKQKKGTTYSDAVDGPSYKINGKERNKILTEIFTGATACVVPSTKEEDGVAYVKHRKTREENDYFNMKTQNYYCQEELAKVNFEVPDYPTETEINSLASLIHTFLEGEAKEPTISYRTTRISSDSKNTEAILCQTPEECKSLIA